MCVSNIGYVVTSCIKWIQPEAEMSSWSGHAGFQTHRTPMYECNGVNVRLDVDIGLFFLNVCILSLQTVAVALCCSYK